MATLNVMDFKPSNCRGDFQATKSILGQLETMRKDGFVNSNQVVEFVMDCLLYKQLFSSLDQLVSTMYHTNNEETIKSWCLNVVQLMELKSKRFKTKMFRGSCQ